MSYEQMMAYQAGVEHSRSFEAFKRSREEAMSHHLDGASRRGAREKHVAASAGPGEDAVPSGAC